jgi:GTPase
VDLADRLLAGDVRALARAISMVENRDAGLPELLVAVRGRAGEAHVIGLTGPPGSGKSTLGDGIVERWRALGRTVGVLAVDPSSPFSGGAILGDRVRMQRHALDRGVYIRSMAARGHLGGLASAAREAIRLIDASGRRHCLLETVGVGQSELEVMLTADTVVVVTTPAAGDGVQLIKAGIMEIADIFAVNKADLPGADRVVKELRRLVHETKGGGAWEPPVVATVATSGQGVDDLVTAVDRHLAWAAESGELQRRRSRRLVAEVEAIVAERAVERARETLRETVDVADPDELACVDPYALADRILNGRPAG